MVNIRNKQTYCFLHEEFHAVGYVERYSSTQFETNMFNCLVYAEETQLHIANCTYLLSLVLFVSCHNDICCHGKCCLKEYEYLWALQINSRTVIVRNADSADPDYPAHSRPGPSLSIRV